jgi:hypothetical protein
MEVEGKGENTGKRKEERDGEEGEREQPEESTS